MKLHLDYETFSEVNLKQTGAYKYASHPSTEILMAGWALDDGEVALWEPHKDKLPSDLKDAIRDPSVIKKAFNANFERLITRDVLKIDTHIESWRCVMVEAYYLSFTGGLGQVLKAVGLPDKDKRGNQLINLFCTPAPKNHHASRYNWENREVEWSQFCEYCVTDVVTERLLSNWMEKFPGIQEWDWKQWFADQEINDRGVLMDVEMAEAALSLWQEQVVSLKQQLQDHTGIVTPTRGPFLSYLQERVDIEDTKKDTLNVVKKDCDEHTKTAIDIWQQKESKATAKYQAVVHASGDDHRARGMFQYKGAARTDRVGGRIVQLQNLKRPFVHPQGIPNLVSAIKKRDAKLLEVLYGMPVADILGGSIRHVLTAPEGHSYAIADLSSIESVVIGWVTNCPLIDQTFREGKDSYKVFATQYFGVPYGAVDKSMRNFCKPPVLGCGFMLGWRGMIKYAEGYGVDMDEEAARKAVDTFRGMYPEICDFWKWIDDSIKYVVESGRPVEGYRMCIERDSDFLRILLPSGRNLSYYKPEVQMLPAPWDADKKIANFTFMGMDIRNQWSRLSAHAGLETENIVQSLAGDILWNGIMNAHDSGHKVVLHVHDEIGVETPDEKAGETLADLIECMVAKSHWNKDMWLGAAGFITKNYTKD
jgi:DNA polymerase